MIATFLTASLLTLLLPLALLVVIGAWWAWAVRGRRVQ